jgi:two-component system response regulator CpxR
MKRILVIDDDVELCELVGRYLRVEGFSVEFVHRGEEGAQTALAEQWDLVVLDVMLPGINGFEVLRQIRASSPVPVLMLTARGEDVDRIVGLELGADDYLPKPYNARELVARIHAILRRAGAGPKGLSATAAKQLVVGDVKMDEGAREVSCAGDLVHLTTVEFDLLRVLMDAAGRVLSREHLYESVLGRKFTPFDRVIDNHVSNLRKKLGPRPDGADRIKTVRNAGYQFTLPVNPLAEGTTRGGN